MIYGCVDLLLCAGIPLAGAVYFMIHRRGMFFTFAAGAGCFLLSQLILRMPLLNLLTEWSDDFALLPYTHPLLYTGILAFTAGLFEETGRWIFLRFLCRKHSSWLHGLSFGLGHGGIEAVWVLSLGILPAFLNGTIILAGPEALLVGVERVCAMCFHIAMTMLVLYGVNRGSFFPCAGAILIHGIFDMTTAIQNTGVIWAILVLSAISAVIFTIWIKNRISIDNNTKGEYV